MYGEIVFDNDQLKTTNPEEIIGQNEFTFWNIVSGMFGDLKLLSDKINDLNVKIA